MERETRFELATFALARRRSTTEPFPHVAIANLFGGNNRARTYDPLLVRQMLSQLSYAPICISARALFSPLRDTYHTTTLFICQYLFESFFEIFQKSFFAQNKGRNPQISPSQAYSSTTTSTISTDTGKQISIPYSLTISMPSYTTMMLSPSVSVGKSPSASFAKQ